MARYESLTVNRGRINQLFLGNANGGLGAESITNTPYTCVMTVGTQATATITVALQFNDISGTAMATKTSYRFWLTSDSTGLALEATGPDSWAAGTDGFIIPDGGDSVISGIGVTEEDGDADIALTKTTVDTMYLNVLLPNGNIVTSGAITFTSTT